MTKQLPANMDVFDSMRLSCNPTNKDACPGNTSLVSFAHNVYKVSSEHRALCDEEHEERANKYSFANMNRLLLMQSNCSLRVESKFQSTAWAHR